MPSTDAHPEPPGHTNQNGSVDELSKPMTIGEAAKYIHMSVSSMRRYDKSGVLPARRTPGGQRRWYRSDLDAWRNNGQQAA